MEHAESYSRKLKQLLLSLQDDETQYQSPNIAASLEQSSQQLYLNVESNVGRNGSKCDKLPAFTLKSLPGRGIGVVATRLIPAGSIILKEEAILTVPDPLTKGVSLDFITNIVDHYTKLPAAKRQRVLDLHAYTRPVQESHIRDFLNTASSDCTLTKAQVNFVVRLHSVFATNSFERTTPLHGSLYLGASRFNHSCLPNCDYGHTSKDNLTVITVCSSRDIQPDEEITVPYINIYKSRDQRRDLTKLVWGFLCNCPACDVTDLTVDTVEHEQRLAQYRRLEEVSNYERRKLTNANPNTWPLKYLEGALRQSVERAQISTALGDNQVVLREYVFSFPAYFPTLLLFMTNLSFIAVAQAPAFCPHLRMQMAPNR